MKICFCFQTSCSKCKYFHGRCFYHLNINCNNSILQSKKFLLCIITQVSIKPQIWFTKFQASDFYYCNYKIIQPCYISKRRIISWNHSTKFVFLLLISVDVPTSYLEIDVALSCEMKRQVIKQHETNINQVNDTIFNIISIFRGEIEFKLFWVQIFWFGLNPI